MIRVGDYPDVMLKLLKDGRSGDFELKHKTIPAGKILQAYKKGVGMHRDLFVEDYPIVSMTEKGDNGVTWMSDTPFEFECLKDVVEFARGDVLIIGLGIGLLPTLIKDKPEVKSITVVELNEDVINLVWNQIKTDKMKIVKGDAFEFLKSTLEKFDTIHVDIWADIIQPYEEIDKVTKLAGRILNGGGKVFCWLSENYELIRESIPKEPVQSTGIGMYPPCKGCGKTLRNDYNGFCMDCADGLGKSELFIKENSQKSFLVKKSSEKISLKQGVKK
jgi:hypothetical protein